MNQCKQCNNYNGTEISGQCRALPPKLMTHLISDVGDDAQLINASVMPMVMSDDPGCGLFKRSPDDVSFISEVQTGRGIFD
jgi:hypothetical protein